MAPIMYRRAKSELYAFMRAFASAALPDAPERDDLGMCNAPLAKHLHKYGMAGGLRRHMRRYTRMAAGGEGSEPPVCWRQRQLRMQERRMLSPRLSDLQHLMLYLRDEMQERRHPTNCVSRKWV